MKSVEEITLKPNFMSQWCNRFSFTLNIESVEYIFSFRIATKQQLLSNVKVNLYISCCH